MASHENTLKYDRDNTALLVIDPYNDFISEGGKVWDRLRSVAEDNGCIPHMIAVLGAALRCPYGCVDGHGRILRGCGLPPADSGLSPGAGANSRRRDTGAPHGGPIPHERRLACHRITHGTESQGALE